MTLHQGKQVLSRYRHHEHENFTHYLESRLHQWAEWYSRGNFFGLDYPSCSLEYRIMTEGNVFRRPGPKPLPNHEAAEEIECLVNEIAQQILR
ncbi:hypothetical protein RINTU1_35060 [Candidatus Regiella insecticola]|uniref:Uncharacterized protein n=1 Tax=Candidatus Regiella insecticola TaxID=138073 RepID=A0A6L2ZSN5_9ENTR|nr:hypothetical protein RINTU1_34940 [Candidatus Regiella insecticola]GFN47432.1 hypothetical protein RINTU1_35060 [Candidatus Regiella insecticola]